MQSLKQFLKMLKGFFHRTAEINLPKNVILDEPLGRYLLFSKFFNPNNHIVHSTAFLPPNNNLKLSVFRIVGLSNADIWKIGEEKVVKRMKVSRTLYGIAEIKVAVVQEKKLKLDIDNNPERHANIIGWPEEKSERKLIAMELAENAKLKLREIKE